MAAFEWLQYHLPRKLLDARLLLTLRAIRAATPYMRRDNQLNKPLRSLPSLHYLTAGELSHFHFPEATSLHLIFLE